ncbi:MAG: hypothetical protein KA831_03315 [Pyrinomonadaceae bacterium]|nr:hypothetical protein [Acidobacteriota bacterium]MBP7415658.1 hypothetical protein [Pyrinomonadaceae bacterium]
MQTPEDIELDKKRRVVDRLADRLADREEELADLRAEQESFEARYTMSVGRLYAEMDEIEAQIAEEEYKLVPDDVEIKKKAEELRRRAEESLARAEEALNHATEWKPTLEAKKAYHNLARTIHPDLAMDAAEKEKRHGLMAELNQAYSAGDQAKLNKLADDLRNSPHLVTGDSVGDELVRTIRQIAQIKLRLIEIRREMEEAQQSELFELHQKVDAEMAEGRDMLAHMANRTKTHINKAERRLQNLRNVNLAAEEYVKQKYGMDISDFR